MDFKDLKEFTKNQHGNQTRKQGTPYYLHPFAVADILKSKGYDLNYQIAGLFHDLLEDTETKYDDLIYLTNYEIANTVRLVTKEKDYNMNDYISRIEKNEMAKAVKLADRVHNLSEAHFASKEWINKYIIETEKLFVTMAKNTPFENEMKDLVIQLKSIINKTSQ